LSGYSYKENSDLHFPDNLGNFDYLKSLPDFLFDDVIVIEVFKTIARQLEYKEYVVKILNSK